jgi:rare lipoprotein A
VSNATTQPGGYLPGDGPGADVPPNLEKIADAAPIDEPLHPYANRPYNALGKTFTPLAAPGNYTERGIASWYGKKFHGQRTSNGDVYDMYGMTAAHPTLPIPSYARVTNTANKKTVVVRINDRGPFLHDRVIDLSYAAALKLDILKGGSSEVEIESLRANKKVAALPAREPILSQPIKSEALPTTTIAYASQPNVVAPVGNIYLQLGAFKTQPAAEAYLAKMRNELGEAGKLSLFEKDGLVRIHIGPYANQDAAHSASDKLQTQLGFKPIVSLH